MFIANAFQREWANNHIFLVTRLINALSISTLWTGGQRCWTSLPFQ